MSGGADWSAAAAAPGFAAGGEPFDCLDRLGPERREHALERVELVVEHDDDLFAAQTLKLPPQRVLLAEHDGAVEPRRFVGDDAADDGGDFAGAAAAQVFVLLDDEAAEAARGDARRLLDQFVRAPPASRTNSRKTSQVSSLSSAPPMTTSGPARRSTFRFAIFQEG